MWSIKTAAVVALVCALAGMAQGADIILNEYNAVDSNDYLNGGDSAADQDGGRASDSYFGRVQGKSQMRVTTSETRESRFGVVWRGIRRKNDRRLAIAGSEWIVIDLQTQHVLAVQRDFARTGFNQNTRERIWWLNASHCPQVKSRSRLSRRFYEWVSRVLRPNSGGKQ